MISYRLVGSANSEIQTKQKTPALQFSHSEAGGGRFFSKAQQKSPQKQTSKTPPAPDPQPKRRADGSAPSEAWTPSASLCARRAQRHEPRNRPPFAVSQQTKAPPVRPPRLPKPQNVSFFNASLPRVPFAQ
jgi:hypothetical protein